MILVAGGTGRLGRIVVERLLSAGEPVRVLSRRPEDAGKTPSSGALEFMVGDVRDRQAVARAVAGARVVISAVSAFGMKGVTPREVDLQGNLNLIAAAESAGVERFVLVSVRGASAQHPMELARMKYGAEQRLRQSRLAWAILRPSTFTETFQQILCAPLLAKGRTVVFGAASNPVNFVSVEDVGRFVELAALTDQLQGAVTDLGGPQNLSLVQFVETFAAALGVGERDPTHPARDPAAALAAGAPLQPDLRAHGPRRRPHGYDRHGVRRDGAVATVPAHSPHDGVRGGAARLRPARAGKGLTP